MKWIRVYLCGFCRETFEEDPFDLDLSVHAAGSSPARFAMNQPDHRPLRFHKCDVRNAYGDQYGFGDFVGVREVGVVESPEVRAIADALSGGPTRDAAPKAPTSCSFCGKHLKEVAKLIVGCEVCICDECVGLCVDIFAKEAVEKDKVE